MRLKFRLAKIYSVQIDFAFRRLDTMSIPQSPLAKKLSAEDARRVRFVPARTGAEVEFRAWTA